MPLDADPAERAEDALDATKAETDLADHGRPTPSPGPPPESDDASSETVSTSARKTKSRKKSKKGQKKAKGRAPADSSSKSGQLPQKWLCFWAAAPRRPILTPFHRSFQIPR